MKLQMIPFAAFAVAIAAGCASTSIPEIPLAKAAEVPAVNVASAVGGDIAAVIASAGEGAKIEFFDADGKALEALPANASGSVSIHAADGSGQQNFGFGDDGKILTHRVSLGDDYSSGVWKEVE